MPKNEWELNVIYHIASEAVSVLGQLGLPCCLTGSTAATLWCTKPFGLDYYRTPDDIDLVVMATGRDVEDVKRLLVQNGSGFTLEDAWDPTKTYKIVFYNAVPPLVEKPRSVKVDVLIPGDMHIPFIPATRFVHLLIDLPKTTYCLPYMPLLPLLITKLQARDSIRNDKQRKDLRKLLRLAVHSGVSWRSFQNVPESFAKMAHKWAINFVNAVPESQDEWEKTGFIRGKELYMNSADKSIPPAKRKPVHKAYKKPGKA